MVGKWEMLRFCQTCIRSEVLSVRCKNPVHHTTESIKLPIRRGYVPSTVTSSDLICELSYFIPQLIAFVIESRCTRLMS